MFLSEITDALYAAGFSDDKVDRWKDQLFKRYPNLEKKAYEHAMSTAVHDPEVPDSWAKEVLAKTGANFYSNPPAAVLTTAAERNTLLQKMIQILPRPRAAGGQKAYQDKIAGISRRVMTSKNMGFSIVHGNTKIGKIDNFSLPAGQNFRGAACPGATELCEQLCYAKDQLFSMNEWRYFANWAYLFLWPDRFADAWATAKLTKVVRIHVGGDFFSVPYVHLWIQIIKSRPDIRFYAYTRSWQNGRGRVSQEFIPALRTLAKLENMRLLLSCDKQTGIPDEYLVPGTLRAWLARDNDDMPAESLELLFRDHDGMDGKVFGMMAGTTVCPVERTEKYIKKSKAITCRNCGYCWSTGFMAFRARNDNPRQFDRFAKLDVEKRASQMFAQVWPYQRPEKLGIRPNPPECTCPEETQENCDGCNRCVICQCRCM